MKGSYDITIVGAGPIGSYTAYQLADRGYSVCVLDEKERIGKDVICTGIVSKQAFMRYDLPTESILSRIHSFTFVSPFGQKLEYIHPDVFAYVVSREDFDEGLLRLAKRCGVDVFLNQRVRHIKKTSNHYTLICRKRKFHGKAVVLATGNRYELQSSLGMGKPAHFLYGSQVELPVSVPESTIEIHIGQKFAPGSFGWIAPLNNHDSRIGVIVERKSKIWLERMLNERVNLSSRILNRKKLRLKPIAYGTIKKSVKDKIIAVGEAAGQVKTTTGGGIFFGLLCSEIAVDKLDESLKNGKGLYDYEITWRSVLSSELEIGKELRKIASSLKDTTIENLFIFVKKNRFWVQLLLPRIDYDFHSNFLFFCLKSFQAIGVKS
jgi:digeranylgeranylglycerophospholipid reductase